MKKLQFVMAVFVFLFIFSCSGSDSDDAGVTQSENTSEIQNVSRPYGWSEETHGKSADPNYDSVFQEGVVKRLDLTISRTDWQIMIEDMTALYGEFGNGELPGMIPGPPNDQIPDGKNPPDGQIPPDGQAPPGDVPGIAVSDINPVWRPCKVKFEDNIWNYVGVRFKGNSSLKNTWGMGNLKLPFRFDFDQFEDDYPEIDDQRFYGFKKLSLSSNYHDDSFIREKVVADIFRDAGVPAPRTAFYRLYIDYGEGSKYFGLYTMVEIPDDPMLEQQFVDPDGNLYKPEGSGATFATYDETSFDKETNEDEEDFSDVSALYNALHSNREDADTWRTGLENALDVDGFLRWLAVNTVIQNWDTYGIMNHNYYLYNDPGDGILHWIPWDNNESLGSSTRSPLSLYLTPDEVNENWPLIRYLMDDDVYWGKYITYVGETVTDLFEPDRMKAIYAEAHELIRPYTVGNEGEIEGYTLLNNPETFDLEIEYLNNHVESRYNEAMEFIAGQ